MSAAPEKEAETLTADVVVVGSGAAGMNAALVARLRGLEVVLVEKADVLGGITATSGGALWVPDNAAGRRQGAVDSLAQGELYMRTVCGADYDEARAPRFLQAGPQMVDFLEQRAGVKFAASMDRPDYYAEQAGGSMGGRFISALEFDGRRLGRHIRWLRPPLREMTFLGMMMRPASDLRHFLNAGRSLKSSLFVVRRLAELAWDRVFHGRSMKLAGGNALIASLLEAGLREGVVYRLGSGARELLRDADGLGARVTGVLCDTPKGTLRVNARRGVVLAAGGFSHDAALRAEHYDHPSGAHQHVSPAPATNTGDGIHMALRLGAYTPRLTDASCWVPVSVVPRPDGTTGAFPHLIDRQKPGFMAVTQDGRRFVNESHSYHEFGRGLIRATRGQDPSCWLLADHTALRQYGMGFAKPAPVPVFPYVRSGYLVRAGSVEDLARQLDMDAAALRATVDTYNRDARTGTDTAFGRGSSAYNRYLGNAAHQPNACMAPMETAPFYALKLHMGELGTMAGLATDEHARVLQRDGSAIPGLYAAGNDMSHVMRGHYLGGGSAIGPCMTYGYIAATHLAQSAQGRSDE